LAAGVLASRESAKAAVAEFKGKEKSMAKKSLKKGKKLAGTKTLSATGGAGAGRAKF
jgi:hypothetical protein